MNRLEDRLRDAFGAAAETVRPESVAGLADRTPVFRARRLAPLMAAVAVAIVIVGASVITPLALAGGHHAPSAPGRAGVPSPTASASRASAGPVTVPLTVGMPVAQAIRVLSDAGLDVATEFQPATGAPAGTVTAQTLVSGTRVAYGATIIVMVAAPGSSPSASAP